MAHQFFRAGVGVVVANDRGLVLGFERVPEGSGRWQFPQGGLEANDDPWPTALRELEEETGLDASCVELLAEHHEWLAYELPEPARSPRTGRGQVQKWFLVRLAAGEESLDLGGKRGAPAEFGRWRWMTMAEMIERVWPVRRDVYRRLAKTFGSHLAGGGETRLSP